jgi:RND superfamily putative drug exporter
VTAHEVIVRVEGDPLAPENLELLFALHEQMRALPDVTEVQSVFTPAKTVGKARLFALLEKPRAEQDPNVRAGLELFTRGGIMRFAVVSAWPFNEERSLAQVTALRALAPPPGGRIQVGGIAAVLWDMQQCFRRVTPWMVGFVALAMFVVLFVVFGSVTLPFKAMVMNSLSLTASFGALVWVFQDGRFADVLDYSPLHLSDATQPLLMFAVVFGLSMDYEVLLLTRVREEFLATGDNSLAVARGLSRTGRLITSAALLLVVVISSFATSKILFMKTLGVGMALAIALDATVIRALLVPATMRLLGAWNWWAPARLTALWKRAGLSDLEG